jgi:ribonucleoside-diphosphate reductase alpha chain
MNAGTDLGLLAGCFVLPVEDSLHSIFTTLGQAAEIQRAGGGTGYAFSHLRPAGDRVATTGGTASGPVSFLRLYDTAAGVVSLGGRRRGACMAVLDASHPDVYDFIATKADAPSELTHFNLSVGVTDAFMRAVERGATHGVVNPRTGKTVARLPAAKLFDIICGAAHVCGDPGLLFLDTINRANALPGRGRIEATSRCCPTSVQLARSTWRMITAVVSTGTGWPSPRWRFLDDVIDVSRYPF